MLAAVQAEQVGPRRLRQQAPEAGMVQVHRLLHERDHVADVGDAVAGLLRPADQLIAELARHPLRLAPRQFERRVLGAVPVAPPGHVIPA
jgi:hypothetical protein